MRAFAMESRANGDLTSGRLSEFSKDFKPVSEVKQWSSVI